MNKGICFHFGYVYQDIEQQIKDIKLAGFNCVIDNADPAFKHENGPNKKRFKLFKKYNLKLSSLHMRYKGEELPEFWKENKIGNKIEKNIIKDVKVAYKYGFKCVVVHLLGCANQIGFCRLRRILKHCEKYNVPLALENLSLNRELLADTFKNVESDYLKFCYDSGHAHAFDEDYDYLTLYKDKVIALHLHDNLGNAPAGVYEKIGYNKTTKHGGEIKINKDLHTLNKYGSINWQELAKKLANIPHEINLDYEVMMGYRRGETSQEVLAEVYKQACELEKLINKLKNDNNENL